MPKTFEEKLIPLVRRHSSLYDPSTKSRPNEKLQSWETIAYKLNCEVRDCQVRWKSLRDRFGREYRDAKNLPAGEGVRWKYYDMMLFLQDFLQPRRFYGTLQIKPDLEESCSMQDQSESDDTPQTTFESKLISLVRKHPVIYDKSIRKYKMQDCREQTWTDIANTLNVEVYHCKSRWKSLRDRFVREYHETGDSENRSSADTELFNVRWQYYDMLLFLKDFSRIRILRTPQVKQNVEENCSPQYQIKTDNTPKTIFERKLISLVRECPVIYDRSIVMYKSKDFKEKSWETIATTLNSDVQHCKGRWKSLRDRFNREYQDAIAFSHKHSSVGKDLVFSRWQHYDMLLFLKEFSKIRQSDNELTAELESDELDISSSRADFLALATETINRISRTQDKRMSFEEKLISLVRENKILYDKTLRTQETRPFKDQIWITIANALDRDVKCCQGRWKNLRDRFTREHKTFPTEGDSTWKYYDMMSFLQDFLKPQRNQYDQEQSEPSNECWEFVDTENYDSSPTKRTKFPGGIKEDWEFDESENYHTSPKKKTTTPSNSISIQCANILWKPSLRHFEYQCSFCHESFLKHQDCLSHLKECQINEMKLFDKFDATGSAADLSDDNHDPDSPYPMTTMNVDPNAETSAIVSYIEQDCIDDIEPCEDELVDSVKVEYNTEYLVIEPQEQTYETLNHTPHDDLESNSCTNEVNEDTENNYMPTGAENRFSSLVCRNFTKYDCDICGIRRWTRNGIFRHIIDGHVSKELFQCPDCPKTFKSKSKMTIHRSNHFNRYSCEYCGKIFSQAYNLRTHIRTHTREKPYKCELCDKSFQTSGDINVHMMRHRGEKPYKCEYCPKAFEINAQLTKHVNSHTREKTYTCDVCGKTMWHKTSFDNHKMMHAGVKPHQCEICGRGFVKRKTLVVHMDTHTGSSLFVCPHCDDSFISWAERDSHEKTVHREK